MAITYTRLHGNGRVARVGSDGRNGWFYAVGNSVSDLRRFGWQPSESDAQTAADAMAHPGCDGVRCSRWSSWGVARKAATSVEF